jgi:hypothetical protein
MEKKNWNNCLTETEKKYLLKFEKNIKKIYFNYISIGLFFCTAIFGLMISIKYHIKDGLLIAIIFGGLGINLYVISRFNLKLYRIIQKLKQL